MTLKLSDFDAITFDVYGTLIDWEPSIIAFLRRWADEDLIMAFDRARAEIQKERPAHFYPEVLRRCFNRISAEFRFTRFGGVKRAPRGNSMGQMGQWVRHG